MASSYPRFQQRKLATLEDGYVEKEKSGRKFTPLCVCVYVRPSKVLIRYRLLGSASRLRESTPRIHFPYFSPTHTHTHTLPPSPLPLPPDFFRFSIDMAHAAHSCSSLARGGGCYTWTRGGGNIPFFFIRESCPNPLTPPKDFFREFHRPKFFFFFASLNRNWDDDIFEKKKVLLNRKPPYPPPCENSCLNLVQLLGPGWWR